MAGVSSNMDPYEILGLAPGASPLEIRRAYLALAKRWHPDVCTEPEATVRFQAVQAAYKLLRDPVARDLYQAIQQAQASKAALDAYRKQQAQRRATSKLRRNRGIGPGRWWR